MILIIIFWKKWVKARTYLLWWAQKQAGPQALSLFNTVVLQPRDHVNSIFFYPSRHMQGLFTGQGWRLLNLQTVGQKPQTNCAVFVNCCKWGGGKVELECRWVGIMWLKAACGSSSGSSSDFGLLETMFWSSSSAEAVGLAVPLSDKSSRFEWC